jgi:hypothetical protein
MAAVFHLVRLSIQTRGRLRPSGPTIADVLRMLAAPELPSNILVTCPSSRTAVTTTTSS